MSSQEGFFDIVYLGIFIILSPAFDPRFYLGGKPPPTLVEEVAHAVQHFHSLLHVFSDRYIILLEGDPVNPNYLVDRMLAEFAAASMVFAKAILEAKDEMEGEVEHRINSSKFAGRIEVVIRGSYPNAHPYYSRCLNQGHSHFLWTGPDVIILPRSEALVSVMKMTSSPELLDFPPHQIYNFDPMPQAGKFHGRGDSFDVGDQQPKKQRR